MLHLGIALMFVAGVVAVVMYWRTYDRWFAAEERANELAAAGAQALEAANKWREAYWALKRRTQPPALTVCAPVFHAPKGLDD